MTNNADLRARELQRLWTAEPRVVTETDLVEPPMRLVDGPSFASQYEEIFINEIYAFPFEGIRPTIIDAGANVGLAVIWWKARWPDARVIAFEPDPLIFKTLQWNTRFHLNLELFQLALSTPSIGNTFRSEGSDGGRLSVSGDTFGTESEVSTVKLSEILQGLEHVDLLKIDIEGAEFDVLSEARTDLCRVERIFVEYHSFVWRPQVLGSLLEELHNGGFRYYLESPMRSIRPFHGVRTNRGIDLQVNIFAWRHHQQ